MKKLFLILALVALVGGMALADDLKLSTDNYIYWYQNIQNAIDNTSWKSYAEITPLLKLSKGFLGDKFSIVLGGDMTFYDFSAFSQLGAAPGSALTANKGLIGGYAYLGFTYDLGFMNGYVHPGFYHDSIPFADIEATMKIPGLPVTFEYLTNDAQKNVGNLYTWVEIAF